MKNNIQIGNLGERKLIELIEDLVLKKTGNPILRDDAFFANISSKNLDEKIVLNSDMLVSTTDAPIQMNSYQIGRKSVLMNISDLMVKGVKPKGIILSFGLPKTLKKRDFIDLLLGIIDFCMKYHLEYIGGDINETKELIISPTVFGFKASSNVIYRRGINIGDILVANNKFGLTGVGFDILLNKKGDIHDFSNYKRSIMSVLEPDISGKEAQILSERKLATASIDSSDGLYKSLYDLMISNPSLGFEIDFNEKLIDSEAINYAQEFNCSLEDLVLNGGEEFIHLFTINPNDYNLAKKEIQSKNGQIIKIGKIISDIYIKIVKKGEKKEVKYHGFEHFIKKT